MGTLTYHHGGEGDGLTELSLDELGHEGGEAGEQRRQVDLRQNHQQEDGTLQRPQSDPRKTWRRKSQVTKLPRRQSTRRTWI